MTATNTIDAAEIEKFSRIALHWWDTSGPFAPLHRLNPVRLSYIRDRAVAHFGRDAGDLTPLQGMTALDIGCGGGLVAEPVARMGAAVTAVDADAEAIGAAQAHVLVVEHEAGLLHARDHGRLVDAVQRAGLGDAGAGAGGVIGDDVDPA